MIKHKRLFIVGAIVLFVYGLIWFVIPNIGLNLYGHDTATNDLAGVIARFWGSTFLGFGVILWLVAVLLLSVLASVMPARNAARLTIREVLAYE